MEAEDDLRDQIGAISEEEYQRRGIKLFVLSPRSPKLNGTVEWAHQTHTEESYEMTKNSFELSELRKELFEIGAGA